MSILPSQVYSWVKRLPVDKRTFLGRLHRGESFAFTPGGVQEVLATGKPKEVVLYLQKRKGFIKLALTTGSPVVPVFAFNLDGSYGHWFPRGRFVEQLSRATGFVPLLFWGRWGVPYGIPNPKKIHVVIGQGKWSSVNVHISMRCSFRPYLSFVSYSAIDVPKEGDKVSQESIDKYHAIFLKELEALFERHKEEAGYGRRQLKII